MYKQFVSAVLSLTFVLQPYLANKILYESIKIGLPYGIAAFTLNQMLKDANAQPIAGVADGQALANTAKTKILGNMPTIDAGNSTITLKNVDPAIPRTANRANTTPAKNALTTDVLPTASSFGSNSQFDNVVTGVVGRMPTENSVQAEAYRTLKSNIRKRQNYQNDPFMTPSKTSLNQNYTGCVVTEVVTPGTARPNIPIYERKTCTRLVPPPITSCSVKRLYTITAGAGTVVGGEASIVNPTTLATSWGNTTYTSGVHTPAKTVSVDWSKVNSVEVSNMVCEDECAIWAKNSNGGSWFPIASTSTNGDNAASCSTNRGGTVTVAPPSIDITSAISGIQNLELQLRTCANGSGSSSATILWSIDNPATYVDQGFQQQPAGCWTTQYNNPFCVADSWTCTDSTPKMAGSTPITIDVVKAAGGKAIWASSEDGVHYEDPNFEATNVCWEATANGLCNFYEQTLECITSANGTLTCPGAPSGGHSDTCNGLISAGCIKESENCMDGGTDPNGACFIYASVYKCLEETLPGGATPPQTTTTSSCGGTRCMGSACAPPSNENNSDFGLFASLVGQLDSMGQDGDCDVNGCILFKGKAFHCHVALSGLFDCCNEKIPGVNWMTYLELARNSYKIAQQQGWIGEMPSIAGIGKSAINGVVQTAGDLLGSEFMSTFDISSAGASLMPSGVTALVDGLVTQAYNWAASTFGPQVAANFFTVNASTGAVSVGAAPGSFMSTVSTVFVYVYVAYLILSIIFKCTEEHMELAAKKQIRACHFNGPYCGKRLLGWCYKKMQSYCCYGSALTRIMQEQIRKQILGWGPAKNPYCGGLTPSELLTVDWNLVDLSEYEAMLRLTNIKPAPGEEGEFYGMDNLTKVNIAGDDVSARRDDPSLGVNAVEALEIQTGSNENTGIEVDKIRMNANQTSTLPP